MEWVHILVAAASTLVIGFIWYHPKLFGSAWMSSLGFTEDDLKKGNMALIYGTGFLISAFIAHRIYQYAGHPDENLGNFAHGMFHGAVSAGGVAVAVLTLNSIFERRSITNILINAGYWLVTLAIMGGLLYTLHGPDPIAQ
jgi:TRAP-type C4-dicarboxylate transport system permease small subunit